MSESEKVNSHLESIYFTDLFFSKCKIEKKEGKQQMEHEYITTSANAFGEFE